MKSFRGSNCKFRFFTIPLWKADRHLVAVIWTIRSDSRVRWPREHLPSSSRPSRPNNANRSTPRVRDTKLTSNNTRSNPLPPSNPTASPAEVLQTANTTKKSCVVCPRCWIWYIPRGGCVGLYEFGSPGSLEGLRPDPSVLGSSHPHTPLRFRFFLPCLTLPIDRLGAVTTWRERGSIKNPYHTSIFPFVSVPDNPVTSVSFFVSLRHTHEIKGATRKCVPVITHHTHLKLLVPSLRPVTDGTP